jgi:hypothetical protein
LSLNQEVIDVLRNMHDLYNAANHPMTSTQSLEDHIDIKTADVLFISREEANSLHREFHQHPELLPHPIMSIYGKTLAAKFPLILVVGREANDSLRMGNEVGPYEFPGKDKNSVPFWDLAYSLVAGSIGIKGAQLKGLCKERDSSAVAFADISSNPIPQREVTKARLRKQLATEDYVAHLRQVASCSIFKRVKLVIFSGLTYPTWASARYADALKTIQSEWDVDFVQVRFLFGPNMEYVKAAFSDKTAEARTILEEWMNQTRSEDIPQHDSNC